MRKTFYIVLLIFCLVIVAVFGFRLLLNHDIKKAQPKAAALFTALENALKLREAEAAATAKYGVDTHSRCLDYHIQKVKAAADLDNNADIKEISRGYMAEDMQNCLSYYKEMGDFIPGLTVRENFTINDGTFDYAILDDLNIVVSELAQNLRSIDGIAKGYVLFYFSAAPRSNGVKRIEVECGGVQYTMGVCQALADKLNNEGPHDIEFFFLEGAKAAD